MPPAVQVAVGHVLGPAAGLLETNRLRAVLGDRHRWHAVRDHLVRQAARARAAEL